MWKGAWTDGGTCKVCKCIVPCGEHFYWYEDNAVSVGGLFCDACIVAVVLMNDPSEVYARGNN